MIYRMSSSKIFSFLLFLLLFATPSKSQNIYIETAKKYSTQTVDYQKFIEEKIVQKDILRCPEPIKMTLKPPFKVYADSAYFLWFVHPYYAKKYEQERVTASEVDYSKNLLNKIKLFDYVDVLYTTK